MKLLISFICLFGLLSTANARIRLRKVKDPPKTCAMMKEDERLSRKDKIVWGTERNSVVVDDSEVTIVNDLGRKICEWDKSAFAAFGNVEDFRFYIDEYHDTIYPYVNQAGTGVTILKVPLQTCSLNEKRTLASLEIPKCDKPKKVSRRSSKKNKA